MKRLLIKNLLTVSSLVIVFSCKPEIKENTKVTKPNQQKEILDHGNLDPSEGFNIVGGLDIGLKDIPATVAIIGQTEYGPEAETYGLSGLVSRGGFCTATFIDSHTLITAAHCVDYKPSNYDGFHVYSTAYQRAKDDFVKASNNPINPKYKKIVGEDDTALLTFKTSQLNPTIQLCDDEVEPGNDAIIVGFGCSDHDYREGCKGGGFDSKRKGYNRILSVGKTINFQGVLSNPSFRGVNKNGINAATSKGDSGGPLLVEQNGKLCIAGVLSRGLRADSNGDSIIDRDVSVYTNVHHKSTKDFLSRHVENADCDIYEQNCKSRATELFDMIWGDHKHYPKALREETIESITEDLEHDVTTLAEAEEKELSRYSTIMAPPAEALQDAEVILGPPEESAWEENLVEELEEIAEELQEVQDQVKEERRLQKAKEREEAKALRIAERKRKAEELRIAKAKARELKRCVKTSDKIRLKSMESKGFIDYRSDYKVYTAQSKRGFAKFDIESDGKFLMSNSSIKLYEGYRGLSHYGAWRGAYSHAATYHADGAPIEIIAKNSDSANKCIKKGSQVYLKMNNKYVRTWQSGKWRGYLFAWDSDVNHPSVRSHAFKIEVVD